MQMKTSLAVVILLGVAGAAYAAGAATAKKSTMMAISEMKWEEFAPGTPLTYAKLWGDRAKGEYGLLLKMPAGGEAGIHAHTGDYHALAIQGTWIHADEGGEWKELPPGSYVMQPGKAMHNDGCRGKDDCIIFIHQHKKGDFIPKPAPKGEKAPEKGAEKAPEMKK